MAEKLASRDNYFCGASRDLPLIVADDDVAAHIAFILPPLLAAEPHARLFVLFPDIRREFLHSLPRFDLFMAGSVGSNVTAVVVGG